MSSMSTMKLVMAREVQQRIRSRSFRITTALLCIGVIGLGFLIRALGDDSPAKYDVAAVGALPPGFAEAAKQTATAVNIELHFHESVARSEADRQARHGEIDVVVDASSGELVSNQKPPDELAAVVNSAWQASKARLAAVGTGLDADQIDQILSPPALRPIVLDTKSANQEAGKVLGTAAAFLLFMAITIYGSLVLTGVVEEKSTGVVEVLLGHVRPRDLLMGKVFGIGVVALTQMTATVAALLVGLWISGESVSGDVWIGLPTMLLWFVLGFILYSTLFALAGSFVSRQEDATGASAPITVLFSAGYLTVFALGDSPYSGVTRLVSVLPPFSPLLMPLRISIGAASVLEITVAAVSLTLATYGMLRLAGSVYGRTLLYRGSRLQWRQALRMRS